MCVSQMQTFVETSEERDT